MMIAFRVSLDLSWIVGDRFMNLVVWIPAMVILGLVTLGLMFAFVTGCDKV